MSEDTPIYPTPSPKEESRANRSLMITLVALTAAVAAVVIIGFLCLNRPDNIIEGQVDGTTVRISGKLPGRLAEVYVHEGDTVTAGDTLARIHSSVVEAQLAQAEAMRNVARAQNQKAEAGTRSQIIEAARDMLAQAEAAQTIAKKTYERMQNLYNDGVVTAQKRDEAKAAYDAATAQAGAARSQLNLALAGAQNEDKRSAAAMVSAADGSVEQVQAVLEDSYLIAPCNGTIDQIYPEAGELVATGTPIMSVLKHERQIIFNVREEMLNTLKMGSEITVMIPALGQKEIKARIFYVRDMGSYAVWRATKATGQWDSRTFEIKARPTDDIDGLRPGMTAILRD